MPPSDANSAHVRIGLDGQRNVQALQADVAVHVVGLLSVVSRLVTRAEGPRSRSRISSRAE